MSAPTAVVFAYHDVGVRCLKVLLSFGFDVPLVLTHEDDPGETRWFGSVAATAADHGLEVAMPADVNAPEWVSRVALMQPDFLFSFYYRRMLGAGLLEVPRRGAFNLHGSLLPKYRGRAPVNWAIVNGERVTGATLHHMVARADAGDIVDQLSVPILEEDLAIEVFAKVTVAAEIVLARSLPALIAGTAPRRRQRLSQGGYFGRRRPEDGRIDWSRPAIEIHNLVRSVAPPYPGAFADILGQRWTIHRTRLARSVHGMAGGPTLFGKAGQCYVACADGGMLQILSAATPEGPVNLSRMSGCLEDHPLPLAPSGPTAARRAGG